jgi:hypothetical protein
MAGVRRRALQAISRPLADVILLTPYSRTLLAKWHLPGELNSIERILLPLTVVRWLEKEYWSEPDPDRRVEKQALLMGGRSGVQWAAGYDAAPFDPQAKTILGNLPFTEAYPHYRWLEASLEKEGDAEVYQLGSSSGREVAYYAERFPHHRFHGTDLYEEVVEFSRQHHPGKNLLFKAVDARGLPQYIAETAGLKRVILFSTGSMQYVQPEHLAQMFQRLGAMAQSIEVLCLEPGQEIVRSPYDLEKSVPRGNFSWCHNYRKQALDGGFAVVRAEIIRPYLPYVVGNPVAGTVNCALHAHREVT